MVTDEKSNLLVNIVRKQSETIDYEIIKLLKFLKDLEPNDQMYFAYECFLLGEIIGKRKERKKSK